MNPFLVAALVPFAALSAYLKKLYEQGVDHVFTLLTDRSWLAGLATNPCFFFVCLFMFRYLRLVVHIISFWCFYKPAPIPSQPTLTPKDCSVILPTVDPQNHDFKECIESCLSNHPGEIIIVTVGRQLAALTHQIVAPYQQTYPNTNIQVHFTKVANKRIQVAHGVGFAIGKITILLDDHVFWKSGRFLPTVLAPFENDKVGAVGTNKRVRRTDTGFNARSFWNMIGALYLERHNFEIRATNAIDGGVFVISGRTAAYRTEILQSPGFMHAFTNERFFFGMFGPLNADDDNFLTRQIVTRGYDIKIQYCRDALIETTLGTYPRFLSQGLRWVRTTWRSNSASLITDRTVWRRQPWCVYAVYLTSFVNFALFYDAALIYSLSTFADRTAMYKLLAWIFFSKMVKLTPYFLREPQDLLMLPGYFLFAYYHSLIKLYAGLTFWVTAWCGRDLGAINAGAGGPDDDDDDSHKFDPYHISSNSQTSVHSSHSSNPPQPPQGPARSVSPSSDWRVDTPWGHMRTRNLSSVPANALDGQNVSRTGMVTQTIIASCLREQHYRQDILVRRVTLGSMQRPVPPTIACSSSSSSPSSNYSSSSSSSSSSCSSDSYSYTTDNSPCSSSKHPESIGISSSRSSCVFPINSSSGSASRRYTPSTISEIAHSPITISSDPSSSSSSSSGSSSRGTPTHPISIPSGSSSSSISKGTPRHPISISSGSIPNHSGSYTSSSSSRGTPTHPISIPSSSGSSSSSSSYYSSSHGIPTHPIPISSSGSSSASPPPRTPWWTYPSPSPSPSKSTSTTSYSSISTPCPPPRPERVPTNPNAYEKAWVRGNQCASLHSDGDKLRSCGCLVEDVFELQRDVVAGRPRF